MIVAFIDELRAGGHAVESICRVLREQDCQIAARTYREWASAKRPVAARTISDAAVINLVRDLVWKAGDDGVRRMTPEGLYGRRKMTVLVRRTLVHASPGSVDRAMRTLGLQGIRRSKGIRTTVAAADGKRAADLLDRDFTATAPNRTWVMDFTTSCGPAGMVAEVTAPGRRCSSSRSNASSNASTPRSSSTPKRRRRSRPCSMPGSTR